MVACGVVFAVFGRQLIELFTADADVLRMGAILMIFAAVYQLFDALYIIYSGALRGAGDTFVPALVTATLCWLMIIAGGGAMAYYVPRFGVAGPWAIATVYGVILGLFMWLRFKRGGWRDINLEAHNTRPGGFPYRHRRPRHSVRDRFDGLRFYPVSCRVAGDEYAPARRRAAAFVARVPPPAPRPRRRGPRRSTRSSSPTAGRLPSPSAASRARWSASPASTPTTSPTARPTVTATTGRNAPPRISATRSKGSPANVPTRPSKSSSTRSTAAGGGRSGRHSRPKSGRASTRATTATAPPTRHWTRASPAPSPKASPPTWRFTGATADCTPRSTSRPS